MTTNHLRVDTIVSPLGNLRLRFGNDGLHEVKIINGQSADIGGQTRHYELRHAFERYFEGDLDALAKVPVAMHGSEFQLRVWEQLRKIPPGTTISYAELARRIGDPRAARAVGSANGRNPLCVIVPCHRVIRADGSLGGFSAGLAAKRWLLRHEGAAFKA